MRFNPPKGETPQVTLNMNTVNSTAIVFQSPEGGDASSDDIKNQSKSIPFATFQSPEGGDASSDILESLAFCMVREKFQSPEGGDASSDSSSKKVVAASGKVSIPRRGRRLK